MNAYRFLGFHSALCSVRCCTTLCMLLTFSSFSPSANVKMFCSKTGFKTYRYSFKIIPKTVENFMALTTFFCSFVPLSDHFYLPIKHSIRMSVL